MELFLRPFFLPADLNAGAECSNSRVPHGSFVVPNASDITETIAEIAVDGVQTAAQDGRSATAISIADLERAKKILAGEAAVSGGNPAGGSRSAWGSLRPARVVPPGGA